MTLDSSSKTILIAPLNWGLGHATRCIPIIKALQENNFTPIIASDGIALELLKKEFPYIQTLQLPYYQIEYAKNGKNFKWKLIQSLPRMLEAIREEKKLVQKWVTKYEIDGIISDNRLGVFSAKIPSVFITHQLNVMTGNTTWFTSKLHQIIIKKYKQCWVPDVSGTPNLTGDLGHLNGKHFPVRYIGPLSRLHKKDSPKLYDLMIILSGPEPQRGILEDKLTEEVKRFQGKVVFIKGIIEKTQVKETVGDVTFYNFMSTRQLVQTFNESEYVLCRSGYTTIMDLVKLGKKAFFIPTPGQYEQEYLAVKLDQERIVPFANQEDFTIEMLSKIADYKGLSEMDTTIDWEELFEVFQTNKTDKAYKLKQIARPYMPYLVI